MTYWTTLLTEQSSKIKSLWATQPELSQGWNALKGAAVTDGALDTKTRELIALALGVAAQCEPCIAFHAQACVKYGATRQEVSDTLAMCVMMGGGPKLMYSAKALAAYDEFAATAK
jgi:AhpD family alkylhydroperoxidase